MLKKKAERLSHSSRSFTLLIQIIYISSSCRTLKTIDFQGDGSHDTQNHTQIRSTIGFMTHSVFFHQNTMDGPDLQFGQRESQSQTFTLKHAAIFQYYSTTLPRKRGLIGNDGAVVTRSDIQLHTHTHTHCVFISQTI